MFNNCLIPNNGPFASASPIVNRHTVLINSALGMFNQARQAVVFEQLKCFILRRFSGLRDLSALPSTQVHSRRYGGLKTVALDMICGSLGRVGDFDYRFHPRSDGLRDRWVSVAMARMQYIPLDPVSLIQVGERYFVQDGHHRISVARASGEIVIDAEVIIWDMCGFLPWDVQPAVHTLPQTA